jgi:hypothetical protein
MNNKNFKILSKKSANFLINMDGDGALFILEKIDPETNESFLSDDGIAAKYWMTNTNEVHPGFIEIVKLLEKSNLLFNGITVTNEGEIMMKLNNQSAFNDVAMAVSYISLTLIRDMRGRVH